MTRRVFVVGSVSAYSTKQGEAVASAHLSDGDVLRVVRPTVSEALAMLRAWLNQEGIRE